MSSAWNRLASLLRLCSLMMANRPERKGRRVIESEPGQQGHARPNLSILAPGPSSSVQPSGYNRPSTPQTQQSTQPPVLTAQSTAQKTYQMPPPSTSTQPKIAIPRLKTASHTDASLAVEKHRVSHACESCRRRKVKCTGEKPRCKHCTDFDLPCIYADGKRDRFKRYVRVTRIFPTPPCPLMTVPTENTLKSRPPTLSSWTLSNP